MQTQQTISNLIKSQFPAFYNDEGPVLIAFMNAYYEWMEQTGNPVNQSRNLFAYSDIDQTLDQFVVYFSNTYLKGIQFDTLSNKRLTVKRILDLYKAKGNIRALKLLFQLVFKEDIEVYLPAGDILKPSDGVWTVPQYLEVSHSSRNMDFVGKQFKGVASGATAFCDRIVRRAVKGNYVDVFFITNVSDKKFQTGELLNVDNNLTGVPTVVGSLSSLIVDNGGYGFAVGDLVTLTSNYGQEGIGRVSAISNTTGIVSFTLNDGGWGFTNSTGSTDGGSTILISNTVLYLSGATSTLPTSQRPVQKFSNVTINNPANNSANLYVNAFAYGSSINLYATPISGTFSIGETINSGDGYANGRVTSISTTSYPLLTLSNYTGTFQYNESVFQSTTGTTTKTGSTLTSGSANVIVTTNSGIYANQVVFSPSLGLANGALVTNVVGTNVIISTAYTGTTNSSATVNFSNVSALGLIQASNSSTITVSNSYGTFSSLYFVKGLTSSANANVSVTSTSISTIGVANVYESYFGSGQIITGASSGANASVLSYSTEIGITGLSGSLTSVYNNISAVYPGYVTITGQNGTFYAGEYAYQSNGSANIATGLISGVNSTALTISPLTGTFSPTTGTNTGIQINTTQATVTSNVGAFLVGETVYQSNGTVNTAYGFLISASSSALVFNVTNGAFVTTNNVIGGISSANAVISALTVTTSAANATISTWTPAGQVNAVLTGFSSGNYANIGIGYVNSTETIFYYSDTIGGNNVSGAPYQLLPLTALAYGFPKNPYANLTIGYLVDILKYSLLNVGEIQNIYLTNPGSGYNHAPYVDLIQTGVASKQKRDYILSIANTAGAFQVNETLSQNVALTGVSQILLGANIALTYAENIYQIASSPTTTFVASSGSSTMAVAVGSTGAYSAGQQVLIGDKDIRTISSVGGSSITLNNAPYSSNSAALAIILASTGYITNVPANNIVYFANTGTSAWTTSSNVYGVSSGATATVTTLNPQAYATAQGRVKFANSTTMIVRRLSLNSDFAKTGASSSQLIVGGLTAATANVLNVAPTGGFAGDNANVTALVTSSNGTVSSLVVQASGIGFVNAESLVFTAQDNSGRFGIARTVLGQQGIGQGYYSSTKGFLSADKYIQDGYFYQNYSYQIKSSLDISKYYQMVTDVVHTAGTALYGAVVKKAFVNAAISISNSNTGPILG
jgi:hypothetical protein